MSLFNAMYAGVSGLSAQSRSLNTISQNIANVNTVGYKGARTEFETLVGGWLGDGASVSGGVRATTQAQIGLQGQLQSTTSTTDLAISGEGFFVVTDPGGATRFTRAGSFSLDANQNLVNTGGYTLAGWKLNGTGQTVDSGNNVIRPDPTGTGHLQAVNLSGLGYSAQPTGNVSLAANLSASTPVGGSFDSGVQVYDSLGGQHGLDIGWERVDRVVLTGQIDPAAPPGPLALAVNTPDGITAGMTLGLSSSAPGSWSLTPSVAGGTVTSGALPLAFDAAGTLTGDTVRDVSVTWDDGTTSLVTLDLAGIAEATGGTGFAGQLNPTGATFKMTVATTDPADTVTSGAAAYVSFDSSGRLIGPGTQALTIDWSDASTTAADGSMLLALGTPGQTDGLTGFAGTSTINSITQDGIAVGAFSGVSIDKTGRVVARFDNGQTRAVFQLPIAQFNNPGGLIAVGGNAYEASIESGRFYLDAAGTGGTGTVSGNALESSTVDLAAEFTAMIVTQRAYSANATIITTADQMLQQLDQLKR